MKNSGPPATAELAAILRLLDDETPEVRRFVAERLESTSGDLSDELAELAWEGSEYERSLLSGILLPARRATLRREWIVPSRGAGGLGDDWDSLEHLLRLLSDYLHDGVTLRQALPDSLDLLADEAVEYAAADSEERLAAFLFGGGRFRGNRESYYDPRNSDLAYAIAMGTSNPIGLCLIYLFVARRLGMEVWGVNFPGHFLCRIDSESGPLIVDCFDGGKLHPMESLVAFQAELAREKRAALADVASPGVVLQRVLLNLASSFAGLKIKDDAALIAELRETLA